MTMDYQILQTWSGEERIFMFLAHLSCAYLCTKIPNEINEESLKSGTHGEGQSWILAYSKRRNGDDEELISLLALVPIAQVARMLQLRVEIITKYNNRTGHQEMLDGK
jgi:hypothetical protein